MDRFRVDWGRPIGRSRVRPWHLAVGGGVFLVFVIVFIVVALTSASAMVSIRALTAPAKKKLVKKPLPAPTKKSLLTNKSKTKTNRLLKKKWKKKHDPRKSPWRL